MASAEWVNLARDRDKCWDVVDKDVKSLVAQNGKNFLKAGKPVNFSTGLCIGELVNWFVSLLVAT